MTHFGCAFTRALESFVYLPFEQAVFDWKFQQKGWLEIRNERLGLDLELCILKWNDILGEALIKNPMTDDERKKNKKLYNI